MEKCCTYYENEQSKVAGFKKKTNRKNVKYYIYYLLKVNSFLNNNILVMEVRYCWEAINWNRGKNSNIITLVNVRVLNLRENYYLVPIIYICLNLVPTIWYFVVLIMQHEGCPFSCSHPCQVTCNKTKVRERKNQ